MRKIISILLCLTLFSGIISGCVNNTVSDSSQSKTYALSVVTTIFPEYDWVK